MFVSFYDFYFSGCVRMVTTQLKIYTLTVLDVSQPWRMTGKDKTSTGLMNSLKVLRCPNQMVGSDGSFLGVQTFLTDHGL